MNHLSNTPVLFQYPGNIIIVDDDASFTEALTLQLFDSYTTSVFNSPHEAIQFFANQRDYIADKLPIITKLKNIDLDTDGFAYTLNYEAIIDLLSNRERYNEPTVLIVDYKMPEMTGLDFLSQIPNHKIKKILLTAHDEKEIALKAFNNGLIDKFVMKASTARDDFLLNEISQLNQTYFQQVTTDMLGKGLFALLHDEAYERLFIEWLHNFAISEYYRLDDYGTVLGITREHKLVWLILQPIAQQESYIEAYNDESDKPLGKNKMIYLCSDVEKGTNPNTWNKFVCEIKGKVKIQGVDMYHTTAENRTLSLLQWQFKKN
ncbi:MAG: response regulator [Gammaproteobacteria bacterium]|nr:response regulator [Gammaproteobacteria bacterium]